MSDVVWIAADLSTVERCHVSDEGDGVRVNSTIDGSDEECVYELVASADWEFRSLTIRSGDRTLTVTYESGEWRVNGVLREDLGAAREVDISASPFSNTLPIRRLHLDLGAGADIVTAYVTVPELTVHTDPQRYTRTSETEYLYESRDSDFRRTIAVDDRGLVLDYPGLFTRG